MDAQLGLHTVIAGLVLWIAALMGWLHWLDRMFQRDVREEAALLTGVLQSLRDRTQRLQSDFLERSRHLDSASNDFVVALEGVLRGAKVVLQEVPHIGAPLADLARAYREVSSTLTEMSKTLVGLGQQLGAFHVTVATTSSKQIQTPATDSSKSENVPAVRRKRSRKSPGRRAPFDPRSLPF